ncbi:MAG: WYL domain-containing protein, partial [Erysipelotrichia bacterium]|nr:WYL domain-containing protein [Erysipelotrichia bacterium]
QIEFKYYEYNERKKKVLKHKGQIYRLSPYALTWNNDQYYILGFSENHNKIVKFRVDRMHNPIITDKVSIPKPKDFDVTEFSKTVFSMYDGKEQQVELLCDTKLMKSIVDKFGKDVNTVAIDKNTFMATVMVSTSPTFYGWVFGFVGQMQIVSPDCVKDEYKRLAKNVCCE